eukprot:GILJ01011026.1.p1 GENE.GILJ01011026.1~~GILJ01011026.1.p1  ORF type:complete len:312 (+),score=24.85 GILJ01011026.1:380-1315(+)
MDVHPTENLLVVAGDKLGNVMLHNFHTSTTVSLENSHNTYTSDVRFFQSSVLSASYDGLFKIYDLETSVGSVLFEARTDREAITSAFLNADSSCLVAGDNVGRLHLFDARSGFQHMSVSGKLHGGKKVTRLHTHPYQPHLVCTGSTEPSVSMFDLRNLHTPIVKLKQDAMITFVEFSPLGDKLLAISKNDALLIWNNLHQMPSCTKPLTVKHPIDPKNAFTVPSRGAWYPFHEDIIAIGGMKRDSVDKGCLPSRPVDFFKASTGDKICTLYDSRGTTISNILRFHPSQPDVMVTASNLRVVRWCPKSIDRD